MIVYWILGDVFMFWLVWVIRDSGMDVIVFVFLLNLGDGGIMYIVMYGDDERINKEINCKN